VWYFKEKRVVLLSAHGLANGRFESEGEALRAARARLLRAGLWGRHTADAVRRRFRAELRRAGGPPPRAYWTRSEDRVIERFARAVVRHEHRDATVAARACLKALGRVKRHFARTFGAARARIEARALALGRRPVLVAWTPEELRFIGELAGKVSSGRFREVRDAARVFQARTARRRRGRAKAGPPERTLGAIGRRLTAVAKNANLAWGFRDWSPEENRIVDGIISRYARGRTRSFRSVAMACRTVLRRLDAARADSPDAGRPFDRSFRAVCQHVRSRAIARGIPRPRFRRWRGPEQRIAAGYAERLTAEGRKPYTWEAATVLRRTLRRRGYQRTLAACKAELRRAWLRLNGML